MPSDQPTLSVIVPCYNASGTVDIAIRSILQQEMDDLEVVVVNDASTDDSKRILEYWAARDSRVRVHHATQNMGIGDVRNLGTDLARGKFVGYVDADDWVTRSYYTSLVRAAESLDVDFVKSDHVRVTGLERTVVAAPEVRRNVRLCPLDGIDDLSQATMVDYAFVWCGLYRRDAVVRHKLDFGNSLRTAEDRIFAWKAHLRCESFACVSEIGYLYRKDSSDSLTAVGDSRQLEFVRCIRETFALLDEHKASESIWNKSYRQALSLVVFHFDKRSRLGPDVWYQYKSICGDLIRSMDAEMLNSILIDFGDRRSDIVRALRDGTADMA